MRAMCPSAFSRQGSPTTESGDPGPNPRRAKKYNKGDAPLRFARPGPPTKISGDPSLAPRRPQFGIAMGTRVNSIQASNTRSQ